MSLSSKCAYVLNWSCKGSGETAQMRILVWAFVARTCSRLIACLNLLLLLNALMFWMGVAKVLARLLKCADSSELSGCSHIVNCVSMSSKCNYILSGSGETAQVRRLAWAFLPCNKNRRRLCDLLMFWLRVVKTLFWLRVVKTFLCRLVQSLQPVKRLRFFPEVERANTFLFWKTNVRKPSFPPLKRWFF